jgi:hypothetical protein
MWHADRLNGGQGREFRQTGWRQPHFGNRVVGVGDESTRAQGTQSGLCGPECSRSGKADIHLNRTLPVPTDLAGCWPGLIAQPWHIAFRLQTPKGLRRVRCIRHLTQGGSQFVQVRRLISGPGQSHAGHSETERDHEPENSFHDENSFIFCS